MKTLLRSLLAFLLLVPSAFSQDNTRPPNIVIIFCDDLGYADIAPFGAKDTPTPHLDRLAREGRRFTNFHVAQPVCSASRASLLTGCYPNRVGIHGALGPNARHGIAAEETTLAEIVKQKNYATAAFGKWHLGHHPEFLPVRHGFDEYLGLPYSNDMWPHHPEARPGTYPPLPLIEGDRVIDEEITPEEQTQLTTRYTERAVSFIDRHKDQPFFLYLAHSMPHVPLFVSEKFRGKSERGLYGDVIMEIDWSVGEVLAALDRHGLAGNTLVVFTSDNGPWLSYGEHSGRAQPLREGKGTCWEGGVRVPCIMRWPGQLEPGTSSDAMFMTIDILPTIAGRIGAKLPERKIDGRDVWDVILGKDTPHPQEGYAYYYHNSQLHAVASGDGQWKLMFPHTYRTIADGPIPAGGKPGRYSQAKVTEPELYDLKADISETKNVAAEHPEIVKRLTAFAERMREDLGDTLTKRAPSGQREPGRLPPPPAPGK